MAAFNSSGGEAAGTGEGAGAGLPPQAERTAQNNAPIKNTLIRKYSMYQLLLKKQ
jgi:hypothetical protein